MRREEAEKRKCAKEVQKQQELVAVEDKEEEEEELEVGPSAPKKRKAQDTVSDGPTSLHTKANRVVEEVRQ